MNGEEAETFLLLFCGNVKKVFLFHQLETRIRNRAFNMKLNTGIEFSHPMMISENSSFCFLLSLMTRKD